MNNVDKNIISIPNLLRSMAISVEYKSHKIILNEAANLIEHLAKIREKAKELVEENQ